MYKDGISPAIRTMVLKINEVGVREIREYCDIHKPRINFRRQIEIVRRIAQIGYAYTAHEYNISRQRAEQTLKRMYAIALEVDGRKKDGDV